jgi:hypothetical protein
VHGISKIIFEKYENDPRFGESCQNRYGTFKRRFIDVAGIHVSRSLYYIYGASGFIAVRTTQARFGRALKKSFGVGAAQPDIIIQTFKPQAAFTMQLYLSIAQRTGSGHW